MNVSPLPPVSLTAGLSVHSFAQPPALSLMTVNLVTAQTATPAPPVVIVPPLPPVSFVGHPFSVISRFLLAYILMHHAEGLEMSGLEHL